MLLFRVCTQCIAECQRLKRMPENAGAAVGPFLAKFIKAGSAQ